MIAGVGSALFGIAGHVARPDFALLPGGQSSALMMLAAVTLTCVLVALLAQGGRIAAAVTAGPLTGRAAALREKSWRAGFLPQRDPDARGRARPRAPTALPAAA
jgi:hypothetical protein